MAKKPKVPLNVLVVESTRQAIKDLSGSLECSQGEVVDRALLAFDAGAVNAGREPDLPGDIPGVSVGLPPKPEGQFRCRCTHTGCRGAWFQGTTRFQSLCGECQDGGHWGDPRNCKECANDQGSI